MITQPTGNDIPAPHRGTTVCRLVPFPGPSQCAESFGFPGPRESGNTLPYSVCLTNLHLSAPSIGRAVYSFGRNNRPTVKHILDHTRDNRTILFPRILESDSYEWPTILPRRIQTNMYNGHYYLTWASYST
jgi:hypothetical protein